MDNYQRLEKVGEGSFGKVYKAIDKETGCLVALKKTKIARERESQGVPPEALREISLLYLLSESIYIVKLLRVEQETNKKGNPNLYLVFEYLDMDLKKFIRSHELEAKSVPAPVIQKFMYQLCKGVTHCHGHGILHRDLKPQNLLVDKEKEILKIADFGLGRAFSVPLGSYTREVVTLRYRAPEILLGGPYSTPVDVWSIGCIFAEMTRGRSLFLGESQYQQLLSIFKLLGTPSDTIWPGVEKLKNWHAFPLWQPQDLAVAVPNLDPEGLDLLRRMLQINPAKRISAKVAMQHAYFGGLDLALF